MLDNPKYKKFISDVKKTAKANQIKIRISKKEFVVPAGETIACAGYFDSEARVLAFSAQGNEADWLGVLAHESCHMDQFLYDGFLWDKCNPGYGAFFHWLEGKDTVTKERLGESVQDIIRLEKDCEQRTVLKIKKYGLPIDIPVYIKKANCYLYAYLYFLEKKRWIPKIYESEKVWSLSPSTFKSEYKKIPVKLYKAFEKNARQIHK